jgi:KDO2-lipid IV(A) lauroyltransferase
MKSLLRVGFVVLGVLPLALMHALGVLLGTLLWWLPTKARRMTLHHLSLCLPELSPAQRHTLARAGGCAAGSTSPRHRRSCARCTPAARA